ncbi:hypothetical protein EAF00_005051 [Botryotinia globosa]|nr:hypothetical protein EAF00_005051 [Botryotinia globosa]
MDPTTISKVQHGNELGTGKLTDELIRLSIDRFDETIDIFDLSDFFFIEGMQPHVNVGIHQTTLLGVMVLGWVELEHWSVDANPTQPNPSIADTAPLQAFKSLGRVVQALCTGHHQASSRYALASRQAWRL